MKASDSGVRLNSSRMFARFLRDAITPKRLKIHSGRVVSVYSKFFTSPIPSSPVFPNRISISVLCGVFSNGADRSLFPHFPGRLRVELEESSKLRDVCLVYFLHPVLLENAAVPQWPFEMVA